MYKCPKRPEKDDESPEAEIKSNCKVLGTKLESSAEAVCETAEPSLQCYINVFSRRSYIQLFKITTYF